MGEELVERDRTARRAGVRGGRDARRLLGASDAAEFG